jgi:glycine/D-amino acid oxidase-like deaminating enzyme
MTVAAMKAAGFRAEPWWWRDAPPMDDAPADPPEATDVAVVGGGYTGLNCALELARAGTDVTVFDAGRIGEGASTRAAGFVSGRSGVGKQIDLVAAVGEARATAILDEADAAYDAFWSRIETESIDCDLRVTGRYMGAHTPKAYAALEKKVALYNTDGRGLYEMIGPDGQDAVVRTDRYIGGMLMKNAASIHPAKYHAGLVRLCRQAGVRFQPRTRVLGVARDGAGFAVATERGVVQARAAALGTNGYTDAAVPWHRRRLIPMSSTILATEPLGAERVAHLMPRLCPVIDTRRVIQFARPTPDHDAILFGGRARFTPVGADESVRILYEQMTGMFPDLAGVKVTHAWSGLMGFTFDFLPKLGVHDGVHYALGCNGGAGIVMMSWLGRKMASGILGTANRASAFEGLPFQSRPFYTGAPWFIPIVGTYYRLRDWLDLKLAGR